MNNRKIFPAEDTDYDLTNNSDCSINENIYIDKLQDKLRTEIMQATPLQFPENRYKTCHYCSVVDKKITTCVLCSNNICVSCNNNDICCACYQSKENTYKIKKHIVNKYKFTGCLGFCINKNRK